MTPQMLMSFPLSLPAVIVSSLSCFTVPPNCEPIQPIFLCVAPLQAYGQTMKEVTPAYGVLLASTHSLVKAWAFLWGKNLPILVLYGLM